MPIRADQLREKEDFQKLILERLHEDNGYIIRPATAYNPAYAMDTEMLFTFLENTQPKTMDKLRGIYGEKTEKKPFLITLIMKLTKRTRVLSMF